MLLGSGVAFLGNSLESADLGVQNDELDRFEPLSGVCLEVLSHMMHFLSAAELR